MITQEKLFKLFSYDKTTGVFIRNVNSGKARKGDIAGNMRKDGYVRICVNSRKEYAHRLAWIYVYGVFPRPLIDHIDGNKTNNAISNLREVDYSGNMQNKKTCQRNNKSGFLGVSAYKGKYRAVISRGNKYISIGVFSTKEEAGEKYIQAKRIIHPYGEL